MSDRKIYTYFVGCICEDGKIYTSYCRRRLEAGYVGAPIKNLAVKK